MEGIIAQQRQWNRERNIKTAESKQKMVDRLKKDLVKPAEPPKKLKFAFNIRPGGGNDVLEVSDLSMAYGQKRLFQNANLEVKKGERGVFAGRQRLRQNHAA